MLQDVYPGQAVGEEFGQQGAERARNILRPLYERGMSLEARNVTQIVNIVRDRAAVDFSTEKDNQGRSALDRSVDAMPQARGMSEEHKSELKGYITNAIKSAFGLTD